MICLEFEASGYPDQHLKERTTERHPISIHMDVFEISPFAAKFSPIFCSVVVVRNEPGELSTEESSQKVPIRARAFPGPDVRNQAIQPCEVLVVKSPGSH